MLSKAACPYCYTRINPRLLAFRCSGRPAPGRTACTPREDSSRVRVLSDRTPLLPSFQPELWRSLVGRHAVCPACHGTTGTRVCPECHSVLPDNFTADSPLFGIVGVRGAGKTVLLTVLGKELTDTVARRLDANIDAVGSSNLLTRLANSRAEMEGQSRALPSQTARKNVVETVPAVYTITLEKAVVAGLKRGVSTIFSFYDTAGEDLTTADRARDQHYLAAADGLILVLDPFGFPANRERAVQRGVDPGSLRDEPRAVLRALTDALREAEHLRAAKKIRKPVAVVVAKIDAFFDQIGPDDPIRLPSPRHPEFDEGQARSLHEHVASLIVRWGGDDVLRALEHNYQTYRFFAASALGAEPEYRANRVNSHGVHPHRVAEPLLWLMAMRGLVGSKE